MPEGIPEGAKVTIRFGLAGVGLSPTKTQALGEDQPLTSLHLAVFGSSGYLKEYVEAVPDSEPMRDSNNDIIYVDYIDPATRGTENEKITKVPLYGFTADLTLTNSKRIIHFIGNGPSSTLSFGYADAVLSSLLSVSGERAYWQMMRIDGIHALQSEELQPYEDLNGETVEYGDFIDGVEFGEEPNRHKGNKVTDGVSYVVSPTTQAQFGQIPLVRNWAKIVVEADRNNENDPCFTPISYAVVHVPDRGTLAPYSSATRGFIENYHEKTYAEISELGYPANLPPNTIIDESIPNIADFKYWDPEEEEHGDPASVAGIGWRNGVAPAGPNGAVYLYERPVPSEQLAPTFVIVYGKYENPDDLEHYGNKCFYKVDLMTDHKYYPIYRNFQYKILIHSIQTLGHATPTAAAAAAGSADVSADINARHLPDISDGHRRLAIQQWMAKTFTDAQHNNTELSAYFMSDLSSNLPNLDPAAVTVEALPMKRGVDAVITSCSIDPPESSDPDDDSYGWRTIHFTTSGPSETIRSQTLRVTGTSGGETLYRDIVITIQNIQEMVAHCADRRIKSEKGTPIDLYIDIPDGLTESMFPLHFQIEPEAMTLSPNNDNLPVEYGESISGNGKSSFHFIKTLDWDEYRGLSSVVDDRDKLWRRIVCHFVSNRDNSSTTIWVKNDDYFESTSAILGNFTDKSFHDLRFLQSIKLVSGHPLTLDFNVDRDPIDGLPEIELMLDGLIPVNPPEGFTPVSDIEYRFTPSDSHVTLNFVTADATGEVYLMLSAEDYESQSLRTHHFTLFHDIGFMDGHATTTLSGWSNVVHGRINMDKNKNVLFGYFDDPDDLNPTVTLLNLDGLTVKYPKTGFPWTPTGPKSSEGASNYHELEFQTNNNQQYHNISFTLSAPGYIEVPAFAYRFRGNIFTYPISGSSAAKVNASSVTGTPLTLTAAMENNPSHYSYAVFDENFSVNDKGAWLSAGQSGTITFTNSVPGTFKFFYIQFNFGKGNYGGDNNKRLFPETGVSSVEGSTFDKYPGNNEQYMWMLPQNTESASITLTAHEDYPMNITGIVIKTFRQN